jgi:hypothetical protein
LAKKHDIKKYKYLKIGFFDQKGCFFQENAKYYIFLESAYQDSHFDTHIALFYENKIFGFSRGGYVNPKMKKMAAGGPKSHFWGILF